MNEVILAAIFAGIGSVITIIGKVIVDIIKAKKEPDEMDMELKQELETEKQKNNEAIAAFTDFGKEISQSVEQLKEEVSSMKDEMTSRIEDIERKMDDYRNETREINKSSLRHEIT